MKKLFIIIILILGLTGFAGYQALAIPAHSTNDTLADMFSSQANILDFLRNKSQSLTQGKLTLNEKEFNSIVKTALALHDDGRRVLAMSDHISTHYTGNKIEVGALINIEKIRRVDNKLYRQIKNIMQQYSWLEREQIYIGIKAKPVADNGVILLNESVSVKIGKLPVPAYILDLAGVDLQPLQQQKLSVKQIHVKDVVVDDDHLTVKASLR